MPFTQQRAIYLVNAGLYYMDLIAQARRKIESELPAANEAAKVLDDSNMNENERQRAATRLWESYKQLADLINIIQHSELDARDVLIGESKHFNSARLKKNEYHAHYMRRWRDGKSEVVDNADVNNIATNPINTTPRSAPEQEKILNELHKDLYSDERESWTTSEIDARIASKIPKQASTAILNQLVRSKRVIHNKSTTRYEIENPNIWAENQESNQCQQ